MPTEFYICTGSLLLAALIGIRQAYLNLQDSEAQLARLMARRAQRKARKRPWVWPS